VSLEPEDAPAGQALPAAGPDVFADDAPLAELHTHLGGSVPVHVLWEIAHAAGVAVPVKDYWEFAELVAVPDQGVAGLPGLDEVYHLVERIQSSPAAVERAVHAMIGGGYRAQRITTVEIRFNPAKRNRGGETDLDHVILAALRSVDRAALEYPAVRAGVVLMCDRTFTRELNETIVAKAIRWADRGVVGVDIAGPRPQAGPDKPSPGPGRWPYADLADAFAAARAAGLGITVHAGEEGEPDELGEVVETLRPDRVGHGVLAARRPDLRRLLADAGVTLELCPTSNLRTGVFGSVEELVDAVRSLHAAGVALTVNTDGPTMQRTNLRDEHALLVSAGAWTVQDAYAANQRAFAASFCRPSR
jgi:adenosine deaminase